MSMAMVPLDARHAHPRAVELFREGAANLSLCIHGNDHDGPELGRPGTEAEALPVAAQALRRALDFEQRTNLTVDRVMVAPHEQLSAGAVRALRACGYEAFCGARPYPWIGSSPDSPWLTRPDDASALVGWRSAELVLGDFPALLRMDFDHPREELVIRAFLGQPLIVYGHHELLQEGLEPLEAVASEINRLGDARWSSVAGIARTAIETRQVGDRLDVRMLGRRVRLTIPDAVRDVRVDASAVRDVMPEPLLVHGATGFSRQDTSGRTLLRVAPAAEIELMVGGGRDLERIRSPRRRARPRARRLVTEWRDRSVGVLQIGGR